VKKVRTALAVGSIMTLVLAGVVFAQGVQALPGSGWWTSFQVQNVDSGDATLAYTAYWYEGSTETTTYSQAEEYTIPEGGSLIYNPGQPPNYPTGSRIGFATSDDHLPSGFSGGVVVMSDKQIRAVVSVGNNPNGDVGTSGGSASAFYQGTLDENVGDTLNFPVVKHNYYGQTTSFYIQAAGGDATVDITYYMDDGETYDETGVSIGEGKSYLFDPAAASVPSGQAAGGGSLGSATVEATSGQIAGVVIEHPHSAAPATFALSTKGFAPDDADTKVVAPVLKLEYYNGNTGWQLQNTTGVAATVNVTFTVTAVQPGSDAESHYSEGEQLTTQVTVPANGSYLFSKGKRAEPGNLDDAGMYDGTFAAGVAVSTQDLVATVNEANSKGKIVYSCFGADNATTKIALPLVKEMFYNQTTAVTVQNVGDNSTSVTLQYKTSTTTYSVGPYTIEGGAAMNFFKLSDDDRWDELYGVGDQVDDTTNNAVTITSTSEDIVAIAQESNQGGTFVDVKNYEGFNLQP
jgi:hypothetical protein